MVKSKFSVLLMLIVLLVSMLYLPLITSLSAAEGTGNNVPYQESAEGASGVPPTKITPTQNDTNGLFDDWQEIFSDNSSSGNAQNWNFSNTNSWLPEAYLNGNNTRLIVGLDNNNPASRSEVGQIAAKHEGKIVDTVSFNDVAGAAVVELPVTSVPSFVGDIAGANLASYVEPNMKMQAQFIPNDPDWSLQWAPQKIQADWAWNTTTGNSSILVAVVDTGIDYTHPDLSANYVPLGFDWVNNDTDVMDDCGHGTHCAGIIAASINNSIGIAGLAQVRIMAEKVLDYSGFGYDDWVANGIIHAVNEGAKIISLSLGGYGDSELLHDAVRYAYSAGVLLVAAAGNDNTNMESYPAAYNEVIAVAATDQNDVKADFSNYGDWIELAAPGVGIYSTMPTYQVYLNSMGYSMNYDYLSGTSMACPQVAGVAALVWSLYPNKSRDWIRQWLRYTADDLGDPGFDVYYGYGRVDARNAVELTPPTHDLIASSWITPPYVEPGTGSMFNVTVLNFGGSDETNVTVELLANDSVVSTDVIGLMPSGDEAIANLPWNPTTEGVYNITAYVIPVSGETSIDNNALSQYIFVGTPVKAVVLRSYGNDDSNSITSWQTLNDQWQLFGNTMVYVDYSSLDKENITYEDIAATGANVLIISCAAGEQFTDSEIAAITQYVHEGHGLIATAGTFSYYVPNNNELLPLFGMNQTTTYSSTTTELLHLLNSSSPLFDNVPNPFILPGVVYSAVPQEGQWDSSDLTGGQYVAMGHFNESAIVTYRGLVYISPWLEDIPTYFIFPLQLLYNAILWSHYQAPQHDLEVSLEAPSYLQPGDSVLLNATVFNMGLNDETNVELDMLLDNSMVSSIVIPELSVNSSYTMQFLWSPTVEKEYNVTAYAPPVVNETELDNNVATIFVTVAEPLIHPVEGQYASYTIYEEDNSTGSTTEMVWNFTYAQYISPYQINVTFLQYQENPYYSSTGWMIVNIFNRLVEEDSGIGWTGLWYPGWIETGINMGSMVNVLDYSLTVTGSRVILVGNRLIDCWEMPLSFSGFTYEFWYDKASGLWIAMDVSYGTQTDHLILQDTNVPIGTSYEHELAVTLDAPTSVEPGEGTVLNATVYNVGLNNETNVMLNIIINGTTTDNATINTLPANENYTLSYLWTPSQPSLYNVTAYTPPVAGEHWTDNNAMTKFVTCFYGSYTRSSILPEWVGGGTAMNWHGDDACWQYTLPFDFPFYGVFYTTIFISSNGLIAFNGPDTDYDNSIPLLAQKLAIAPAWDDWVTDSPHDIYIWTNSTCLGIVWYARSYGGSITNCYFEALLSSDGVIQFDYGNCDGPASATLGISNGVDQILAEDQTNLNNALTIIFTPSPSHAVPGDMNGDGKVTLVDLVLFAHAYGSSPGDPNWNPNADIAEPWGKIGLPDFVTLAMYYGRRYP